MRENVVAYLERSYKLLMDEVNRTHEPHASLKMKTISKVSIILLQLRCMHIGVGCCWDNLGNEMYSLLAHVLSQVMQHKRKLYL